jgi:glutaredoxin
MIKVIIYSKVNCNYCIRAKNLLASLGVIYEDRIVGEKYTGDDVRKHCYSLNDKANITTVPQIILIKNNVESYLGGYQELIALQQLLKSEN